MNEVNLLPMWNPNVCFQSADGSPPSPSSVLAPPSFTGGSQGCQITCVRTEAEPRVEEAQPLKVRHNLYSSAWPHWPSLESRSCWAAEERATGFLDESLDAPSWSTPINSPFIFLPATTMEPL